MRVGGCVSSRNGVMVIIMSDTVSGLSADLDAAMKKPYHYRTTETIMDKMFAAMTAADAARIREVILTNSLPLDRVRGVLRSNGVDPVPSRATMSRWREENEQKDGAA